MGQNYLEYVLCSSFSISFMDFTLAFKFQVALEDPKRFRIELTFSRGADLSPLQVNDIYCSLISNIE